MSIKSVHLVESSPTLRALQEEKRQVGQDVWCSNVELGWHDAARGYPYGGWDGKRVCPLVPAARTILRRSDNGPISRFLHSPLAVSSHERSLFTSQTRFALFSSWSSLLCGTSPRFSSRPIAACVEGSAASFRIARRFGTLIPQEAGQHVAIRLRNRASRRRLLSCTYPLISH